jgi:molybdopterin-biosynthesis enzyme MoeA-like protein
VLAWLAEYGDYSRADLAEGTAEIPAGSTFIPNHEGVAPGCIVENCYVLPGVPAEMHRMFAEVADAFSGQQRHVVTVDAGEPESALIDRLESVRSLFPVTVGSYPGEYVTLRFEGTEAEVVEEAAAWMRERVDPPEK